MFYEFLAMKESPGDGFRIIVSSDKRVFLHKHIVDLAFEGLA